MPHTREDKIVDNMIANLKEMSSYKFMKKISPDALRQFIRAANIAVSHADFSERAQVDMRLKGR